VQRGLQAGLAGGDRVSVGGDWFGSEVGGVLCWRVGAGALRVGDELGWS
jgi:hypothetical protein